MDKAFQLSFSCQPRTRIASNSQVVEGACVELRSVRSPWSRIGFETHAWVIDRQLTKCFSTYFSDVLSYNMCIYHTLSSNANAYNIRLRWMFSSNLKFQTLNQTEGGKISVHVYSSYFDVEVR